MQTRSQTNRLNGLLYTVDIDFDEASKAWKLNKISIGNGSYKYICKHLSKTNKICARKCLQNEEYCSVHLKISKGCV